MRKPPILATTLLIRLGPENESIMGDLLEEYAAGRSRRWYWRQVVALVVMNTVAQVGAARPFARPIVLAYALSVAVVLVAAAMLVEILIQRHGALPVPHPLFYIVSVTLPYQWRSGLVLVPVVIVMSGLGRAPSTPT